MFSKAILAAGMAAMTVAPVAAQEASLPLGDGHISSSPHKGYVMVCRLPRGGGGAQRDGDWIQGNRWYPGRKLHVQGRHSWPNATFRAVLVTRGGTTARELFGNGLPTKGTTGTFPVSRDDPAFRYDRNPNRVTALPGTLYIPAQPRAAAQPGCVPMGMIGVALNGVAIFNGLDAVGRDAAAHEIQDSCDGHPQRAGQYHYHGPSPCMPGVNGKATLVGYALDGYGIYSLRDAQGRAYRNADLDACHGTTGTVMWNGRKQRVYHYVLTSEYPYTIGCFHGTAVRTRR